MTDATPVPPRKGRSYQRKVDKHRINFSLNVSTMDMLSAIAKNMGISQTAVLEIAIRNLAKQEGTQTMPYTRRQELIEKIAERIYNAQWSDAELERANLAGWTIDIRFADGEYVSENNWSRVEDIHLDPDELAQAKQLAASF